MRLSGAEEFAPRRAGLVAVAAVEGGLTAATTFDDADVIPESAEDTFGVTHVDRAQHGEEAGHEQGNAGHARNRSHGRGWRQAGAGGGQTASWSP